MGSHCTMWPNLRCIWGKQLKMERSCDSTAKLYHIYIYLIIPIGPRVLYGPQEINSNQWLWFWKDFPPELYVCALDSHYLWHLRHWKVIYARLILMAYGYMIVKIILLARLASIDGAIKLREELTIIYNHNKQAEPTNGHEARGTTWRCPVEILDGKLIYQVFLIYWCNFLVYILNFPSIFLGFRCFLLVVMSWNWKRTFLILSSYSKRRYCRRRYYTI